MKARVRIVARGSAYPVLESQPPVALRAADGAIYLVGSAAGPLGGDEVDIDVSVTAGSALTIRSAAATVVLAGHGRSRMRVRARVACGATLVWTPEPTVVSAHAEHEVEAHVELATGARLHWREEVVAGREDEPGGRARLRLAVDRAGRPLVRHEIETGAGTDTFPLLGTHRATGSLLVVGCAPAAPPGQPGAEHALLAVAPDAALVSAVGAVAAVRTLLDDASVIDGGYRQARR